jgi:hypothetical protein
LTPGAPRADDNTVAPVGQSGVVGQDFRLRFGLEVHSSVVPVGTAYKLQFAKRTAPDCPNQLTGWAAVGAATAISFKTNPSAISGAAISAYAEDPVSATDYTWARQSYISNAADFVVMTDIIGNYAGLWDFSLTNHSATELTDYCFRAVNSNGSLVDNYKQYPEITTSQEAYVNISLADDKVDFSVAPATMSSASNGATIATNNKLGMHIQMSAATANTNLVRTSGGQTIPTLSAATIANPVVIDGDTAAWGWRVDGLGGFTGTTTLETNISSSAFNWAAILDSSQAATIKNLSAATDLSTIGGTNTPESLTVWYAASATYRIPAGAYQQTILYTALPNT